MSETDADQAAPKRPKSKLRWLVRGGIALVVLLIAALITVGMLAKSFVSPDYIVAAIEAENNCRVQIASTNVSLLSFPAKVEITGVKVGPRDEHADAGTKLADRPPIEGPLALSAGSILLEANLLDLLRKKISVKHLTLNEVSIGELLIEEEGGPRLTKDGPKLDALFDPPSTVSGSANPEYEEKKKRREAAKERRKLEKEQRIENNEEKFAITELPLPATMNVLNFSDAKLYAKIRKNKTRITFSNIQVNISDIDVDPGDLKAHNKARVTITCHLDIEDRTRTIKYADLDIRSEGEVIPFDPVTGYLNPDLTYTITVLKGSKLDTIPSLVKLGTKIKKLNEIGLKLDALADSVTFQQDTAVTLGYRDDAIRILQPTQIEFNGHLLAIQEGAWFHTGTNEHEAVAEVLVSPEASDKALTNAKAFLTEKLGSLGLDGDLEAKIKKYSAKLLDPVTKDGQVWVPFTSTGDLNDPKVRPDVDLESLAETIALEALGDLLDSTQKGAGGQ